MFCKQVDFPELPKELIDQVVKEYDQKKNLLVPIKDFEYFKMLPSSQDTIDDKNSIQQDLTNNIGISPLMAREIFGDRICYFGLMTAPKILTQWINENIKIKNAHYGIQEFELGNCFVPHIDLSRNKAYNYIILEGGNNVKTSFYKPKVEYANFNITPRTLIPYDRIQEIESTICKKDKWYQLDVNQIHSVEDIDRDKRRLSITISVID